MSTNSPENVVEVASHGLLGRLAEITRELCADYPDIATAEPWEQLYAMEQSFRGTNAANVDLHAVIEKLRIRCGMTKEDVADLGWPNDGTLAAARRGPNPT